MPPHDSSSRLPSERLRQTHPRATPHGGGPHAIETVIRQPPDRWLSNAQVTHYQAVLLNPERIRFGTASSLNPVTLLPETGPESQVQDDCHQILAEAHGPRKDPTDQPVPDADHTWYTDGSSFLHQGRYGARYLLVSIDTFSGWTEAFPRKQESAQVVVKKILEDIFPHFSLPKVLGSGNGPAFVFQPTGPAEGPTADPEPSLEAPGSGVPVQESGGASSFPDWRLCLCPQTSVQDPRTSLEGAIYCAADPSDRH